MSISAAPTPEKKADKQGFSKEFVIFVVVMVALAAATYAFVFFDSKPVKMEPIWTGTGTVVSLNHVPSSQETVMFCTRTCHSEIRQNPEFWQLTVREASGAESTTRITKGQFDTLHPGDTFTRK